MIMVPQPIFRRAAGSSEDWNYVSGRASALERAFLPEEFFPELVRTRSPEEAFAPLAESAPAVFPHLKSIYDYDRILRRRLEDSVRSVAADCPPDGPAVIFLTEIELGEVHEYLTGKEVPRKTPEEMTRAARRLAGAYPWIDPLDLSGERAEIFGSHPVRAFSLWVDSSFVRSLLRLAARRAELGPYPRALAALQAVKTCVRAVRSSLAASTLTAFFFRPEVLRAGLREPADPAAPLSLLLREYEIEGLGVTEENFSESYARAADDYLTALAARGRFEAFGPLKILYFLRRLWVETIDLRIALSAVLAPIDREVAGSRLRQI